MKRLLVAVITAGLLVGVSGQSIAAKKMKLKWQPLQTQVAMDVVKKGWDKNMANKPGWGLYVVDDFTYDRGSGMINLMLKEVKTGMEVSTGLTTPQWLGFFDTCIYTDKGVAVGALIEGMDITTFAVPSYK